MGLVGSLDDLSLADLLQVFGLFRKSGLLSLQTPEGEGWILLESGHVAGAHAKGGPPDLDALLRSHGIDSGHGLPPPARVDELRREAAERAVLRMLSFESGEFRFDSAGALDAVRGTGLLLARPIPGEYLALEAVRLHDEAASALEPVAPPGVAIAPAEDAPFRAALVVIDPALGALEWLKGCLERSFARVHVFQRTELGVMRIRQYLARGEIPVVLLARETRPDPVSGIRDAAELVARFEQQAPRMPIVLLVEREGPPAALRAPAARGLAGVVARPPAEKIQRSRAGAELAASGEALRVALVAAVRAAGIA